MSVSFFSESLILFILTELRCLPVFEPRHVFKNNDLYSFLDFTKDFSDDGALHFYCDWFSLEDIL